MSAVCRWLFCFCVFGFVVSPALAAEIDGQVRTSARPGLTTPAIVQLLDGAKVLFEQYTDLDGRFEFHDVPPRAYTLRVRYPGFKDALSPIEITNSNSATSIPVTMRPVEQPVQESAGGVAVVGVDELRIPRNAKKEYEAGLDDHRHGNCASAAAHLEKAVAIYPRYGDAFNELGNCARETGNAAGAETDYLKAISLSSSIYASLNLADVYAKDRRFDDAKRIISDAIRQYPAEGDLYFGLSRIYFDQGLLREAEKAGVEAHQRVHRTAAVHLLLAKVYLQLKDYNAVREQLQTYLVENPAGSVADEVRRNLADISTR